MSARAAVQTLISSDSELATIGVGNVYAANTVDTPEEDLFIIVKWEGTQVAFKSKGIDRLVLWVHDRNPDYTRITQVLKRLKTLFTDSIHISGEDGWVLTVSEWLGEGPDLYDPGYLTVTRFSEFNVVSRYASP